MNANSIHVKRTATVLRPDQSRVLLRPFSPEDSQRAGRIIARIMLLPETRVGPLLDEVSAEFSQRHQQIHKSFLERFEQVRDLLLTDEEISEQRQLLIGSYFVCEFSLESAALFNPSIVPHPDQSDLPPGALRFVLSLRATGEGHISSVTFRTGVVDARNNISINEPTRHCLEPATGPNAAYQKPIFARKLEELGLAGDFSRHALKDLGDTFTLDELLAAAGTALKQLPAGDQDTETLARKILALAQSNYEVQFAPGSRLSERVLFPMTPSQSNGIEDARFVRFTNDDG